MSLIKQRQISLFYLNLIDTAECTATGAKVALHLVQPVKRRLHGFFFFTG
jgi:hypothetical protein